jgi:hypothetical protein
MHLNLEKIRIDCGTQARATINQDTVADYAESMRTGSIFPAVTVFFDGVDYYLADGFHRYFATAKVGSPGIEASIINGTVRDAILYSLGANDEHGLRRTAADKRKAIMIMLADAEWRDWNNKAIATACHCSVDLVQKVREESGIEKGETKVIRSGKVVTMKTPTGRKSGEKGGLPFGKPNGTDEDFEKEAKDVESEKLKAAIDMLRQDNEDLADKLAIAAMDADDLDKEMAESTIKDLRAQIRLLEIELRAVTDSRDSLQRENAQLMRQCNSLVKKLKAT